MKNILKNKKAVNIIELMFALMITSIGLFGYFTMLTVSSKSNRSSYDWIVAKSLSQNLLSKLKYLNYSHSYLVHTPGTHANINPKDGLSTSEKNLITNSSDPSFANRLKIRINHLGYTNLELPGKPQYKYEIYYMICDRQYTVTDCPNNFSGSLGVAGLKKISVTTLWADSVNRYQNVTLTAVISDY